MTFLRLFATAACLLPSILWKEAFVSASPDSAEAIASQKAHYETLLKDYAEADCEDRWAAFPTLDTTDFTLQFGESMDFSGGLVCSCGLIYDQAASVMEVLQEVDDETSTETPKLDAVIKGRTASSAAACIGGSADGWPCKNVDLVGHVPISDLRITGSNQTPDSANDVWGWTDEASGREFVIMGVYEGNFFFEADEATGLTLLGYLPSSVSGGAIQGDMKVLGNYAYIGSEAFNHGLQIFDLTKLLTIDPNTDCVNPGYCQELTVDKLYKGSNPSPIKNSHNIVVNEDNPDHVYVVGTGFFFQKPCKGGLLVVNVEDPTNPFTEDCFGKDGYVHDAQCVYYDGPDPNYDISNEICFCYNEDTVTIVDVTDKTDMKVISKINYSKTGYTHQGWLSSDKKYIVFGDETDEFEGKVAKTRSLVVNVEDLANPGSVEEYFGPNPSIDHNLYIVKATAEGQDYDEELYGDTDLIYEANYSSGLQILQVLDYATADFVEVGFFDTFPPNNGGQFVGAWSSYPFFKSGLVAINSIEEGLFLVKPNLEDALIPPGGIDCTDDPTAEYQGKNCAFLANSDGIAQKCDKTVGGFLVSNVCRETCGKAGVGICKDEF